MTKREQTTTSVTIDNPDMEYVKRKKLKPSNLLRAKIQELKEKDLEETNEIQETIKRLNRQKDRLISFIQSEGLMEKFFNFKDPED